MINSQSLKNIFFVMGSTNVGKSTFLNGAKSVFKNVELIEVGKILRAKYPPSYFQGQAAPEKTKEEAWNLMLDGVNTAVDKGADLILIDGQPREISQYENIRRLFFFAKDSKYFAYNVAFINLFCNREIRADRAQKRDGADPEKLKLSLSRLDGDAVINYEILNRILIDKLPLYTLDTGKPDFSTMNSVVDIVLTK